jgi:hypothetical protein
MTAKLAAKGIAVREAAGLPKPLEKATGIMRDMSAAGAFFWISGDHPIGETISFSIGLRTDWGTMAWVCQGDVVRKERRGAESGVTVKITRTAVERDSL